MSIRIVLLFLVMIGLAVYAWRDWFVSLCGLILLTTLSQHPDTPHALFGIPGLNPWNVLFAIVVVGWFVRRSRNPQKTPPLFRGLFLAYLAVLILGAVRALLDYDTLAARAYPRDMVHLLFDLILNPMKFLLLGMLVYDGCRTRRRMVQGITTILLLGLFHVLMMYKALKGQVFTVTYEDARRLTEKVIGLHANDLAGLFVMTFWSAVVAAFVLRGRRRWAACALAVLTIPPLIGCQSLAAYSACVIVGLGLGAVRWRGLLLTFPVLLGVLLTVFPQIHERVTLAGENREAATAGDEPTLNEYTTGRTHNIWAPTWDQICEAPLLGFGRLGIARTDAYHEIIAREGHFTGHPHNSYLEIMVDSGMVGLLIVVGLLATLGRMALSMIRTRADPLVALVGGVAFVAVLSIASLSLSSSFLYPKASNLWFICTAALAARMWAMHTARVHGRTGAQPPQSFPTVRLTPAVP